MVLLTAAVHAQTWPTKPIRLVVGFAPGGTTDVLARAVAKAISESLGQPVVVDNKAGASGNIAAAEVARSLADGYTFLYAPTSGETSVPSLFAKIRPSKAVLTPVVGAGVGQVYLVTSPHNQAKDAKEFIAYAKANPGKLTFSSPGSGTLPHLAAEQFMQVTGVAARHVPYRGGGPALIDLVSGQVDFTMDTGVTFQHVRTGKAKMLAVVSAKRSPFFPDVPTLAELGFPGAEMDVWFGVWSPEGVRPDINERMTAEVEKALTLPATKALFEVAGVENFGLSTIQFKSHIAAETNQISTLVRKNKISIE